MNSKEDRLSRTDAAKAFAKAINEVPAEESQTFAICGEWGTGKTFFAEMVIEKVVAEKIRLNSWALGSHSAFVEDLASQLSDRLAISKNPHERAEIYLSLTRFSTIVGTTLTAVGVKPEGVAILALATLFGLASKSLKNLKSRSTLRQELSETCRKLGKPIWIIIDDIDRMSTEDVREVMRVVSCYRELPYIKFLIIFDYDYVLNAFQGYEKENREEFLEKLVDFKEFLPPIDSNEIMSRFYESMESAFPQEFSRSEELTDNNERWTKIVVSLLLTYRQLEKFERILKYKIDGCIVNGIRYGHSTDLALLSILQLRCPKLFHLLMMLDRGGERTIFGESTFLIKNGNKVPEFYARFKENIRELGEGEIAAVRLIFQTLYPMIDWSSGEVGDFNRRDEYSKKRFRDDRWRPLYRKRDLTKIWLTDDEWDLISEEARNGVIDIETFTWQSDTQESMIKANCIFSRVGEWDSALKISIVRKCLDEIRLIRCQPADWVNVRKYNKYMEYISDILLKIELQDIFTQGLFDEIIEDTSVVTYCLFYWHFSRGVDANGEYLKSLWLYKEEIERRFKEMLDQRTLYDDGGWLELAYRKLCSINRREAEQMEFMNDDLLFKKYLEGVLVHRHDPKNEILVSSHRIDDPFVNRIVNFKGELNTAARQVQVDYQDALEKAKAGDWELSVPQDKDNGDF
ncbi:MAG: AAA family ATPase [Fimbriimonadaceae bacterium]|nr:MAG: AAA family ATPase [Fimbriimonadaceae bacterium]